MKRPYPTPPKPERSDPIDVWDRWYHECYTARAAYYHQLAEQHEGTKKYGPYMSQARQAEQDAARWLANWQSNRPEQTGETSQTNGS